MKYPLASMLGWAVMMAASSGIPALADDIGAAQERACAGAEASLSGSLAPDRIDAYYGAMVQANTGASAYNFPAFLGRLEGANREKFVRILILKWACPDNLRMSGVRGTPGGVGRFSIGWESFFVAFLNTDNGRISFPSGAYETMDAFVEAFIARNPLQ